MTSQMFGHKLKTKQTTGDGVLVRKVMVAEALDIARETYFAIVMDRAHQGPVMVASPAGGMDIEEVAEKTPEKIFKVNFVRRVVLAHSGRSSSQPPVYCGHCIRWLTVYSGHYINQLPVYSGHFV